MNLRKYYNSIVNYHPLPLHQPHGQPLHEYDHYLSNLIHPPNLQSSLKCHEYDHSISNWH
jgi:hypothetical protein